MEQSHPNLRAAALGAAQSCCHEPGVPELLLGPAWGPQAPAGTGTGSLGSVGKEDEELPMGCGTICWRWEQENGLE